MPCYRCGARQVDPDRGESPWRRGVRSDRQVLICPGCQAAVDWAADLDRCSVCSSVHLVRRLGEAECRDCGCVGQPVVAETLSAQTRSGEARSGEPLAGEPLAGEALAADGPADGAAGLAEEVEQALSRVLGTSSRPPLSGRPPFAMS
jgi:hypothetical protein